MKTLALASLLVLPLAGQTVNPDRPYLTYFASTPAKGLLQAEVGGYRAEADDKTIYTSTPVLARYGLLEGLEVRASFDGYTRTKAPNGIVDPSGYGDLTAGLKWNYGTFLGINQSVLVLHKFQTASVAKGLTSGAEDTTFGLLLSKEVGGSICLDANLLNTSVGRVGASNVNVPAASLCATLGISPELTLATEVYVAGKTEATTKQAINQWVLGYRLSRKVVVDAAVGFGLVTTSPKFTVALGISVGF